MRAFVNTEVTKEEVLVSLAEHRKADRLIKGYYWRNGRGCAIGCTIHDFWPGAEDDCVVYESLFGIPYDLAYLEDGIFENLPHELSQVWPERFMTAVPIGANLTWVVREFVYWLLSGTDSPIAQWHDEPHIVIVRELQARELAGGDPPIQEELIAISAASDAGNNAVDIIERGAARDAVRIVKWVTNGTTWDKRGTAYEVMADKLIEFIKQAPR